jgi:hypothetical protein
MKIGSQGTLGLSWNSPPTVYLCGAWVDLACNILFAAFSIKLVMNSLPCSVVAPALGITLQRASRWQIHWGGNATDMRDGAAARQSRFELSARMTSQPAVFSAALCRRKPWPMEEGSAGGISLWQRASPGNQIGQQRQRRLGGRQPAKGDHDVVGQFANSDRLL